MNLIIGSNGDGKTTFYDALDWLFRTDGTNKMDTRFISKKRIDELFPNESDDVRVAMTYEHNGKAKTLEKMFHFTKSFDGEVSTSNYTFSLIEGNGIERSKKDGTFFDRDVHAEMRKFIMFKGEDDLNVLQSTNALKILVDTFSAVKDFDAYFAFMEYATAHADKARDAAQKLDRKHQKEINDCKRIIEQEEKLLTDIEREIKMKEDEAGNFDSLLKNIEQSKEASKLMKAVNSRIESLSQKRAETVARIKENYTISLLDDMWILMGFKDVADAYSAQISEVDKLSRKMEQDYLVTEGQKRAIKKMKTDFVPLPANIPGRKYLQEMLDEEVCKICGRRAEKDSDAWKYMKHRLDEFEASLENEVEEDILPFYENHFISELRDLNSVLESQLPKTSKIRHLIQEAIALNNRLHGDVKKFEANLNEEYEKKKRILAQTDGLTEEQLMANYDNISIWMDKKNRAENRLDTLKRQREQHRAKLEDTQIALSKVSEGTAAEMYAKTSLILRQISDAFKYAKEKNKRNLLNEIEEDSNLFLEKLNTKDFKGTIRIIEKQNGQCESFLMNNDSTRIFNPNTALKTTYLMSILFAIGKQSIEKDKTELPLIFDAPTSSFTDTKENEFFNVISTLGKQVIIVTKSFLRDDSKGGVNLDIERVQKIYGRVFRIEKKKPFDDKKLQTIQTIISKIK
jgi:DNA sulfur modification protein DndD